MVGIDAKFESARHGRRANHAEACAQIGEAAHRAIDRRASAPECNLTSLEDASPDARINRFEGQPLGTSVSTLCLRVIKGVVGAAQKSFDVGRGRPGRTISLAVKTIDGGQAEAR
jgi:hypothetical protein